MSKWVGPFNPQSVSTSRQPFRIENARLIFWSSRLARRRLMLIPLSAVCIAISACSQKQTPATAEQPTKQETSPASNSLLPNESPGSGQGSLVLPTGFGKRTGDLDEMVKNRAIRALVIVNPISFFYQQGRPQGIQYEALQEFEKFINLKEKTGKLPVKVVFLPMRPDQLEASLTQGLGDIIAYGVVITPEREQRVAFSEPIQKNVPQLVVTGPSLNVSSFDDMAGKAIYVNPLTTYYDNLKKVSDVQQKAGKPPLDIKEADKNLDDDDLIEMVNAGHSGHSDKQEPRRSVVAGIAESQASSGVDRCQWRRPRPGDAQEQSSVQTSSGRVCGKPCRGDLVR